MVNVRCVKMELSLTKLSRYALSVTKPVPLVSTVINVRRARLGSNLVRRSAYSVPKMNSSKEMSVWNVVLVVLNAQDSANAIAVMKTRFWM